MTWLAIAIALTVINLVAAELFDWFPWLAMSIVRRAAVRLGPAFRERYEQEWLAEMESIPGRKISWLIFATCVYVRAGATQRALRVSSKPSRLVGAFYRVIELAFAFIFLPMWMLVTVAITLLSAFGRAAGSSSFVCVGPDAKPFVVRVHIQLARTWLDTFTVRSADYSLQTRARSGFASTALQTAAVFTAVLSPIVRGKLTLRRGPAAWILGEFPADVQRGAVKKADLPPRRPGSVETLHAIMRFTDTHGWAGSSRRATA